MDAKTRILKAGARIVLEKGFCDTGLAEVLEAAKVPKGSFYFHFKNKEDFGLQLIDSFAEVLKAGQEKAYGTKACRTWNGSARPSAGRRNFFAKTISWAVARSAICPWKWVTGTRRSGKN
jgi:AcrR family transcriptional regulator